MRILVATDFSPRSQRAVRRAGILATKSRGTVILMHVVDGPDCPETAQDICEARMMTIEQIAVVHELYRVECNPLVVRGNPSDAIRKAALAHGADLIVAGSRWGAPNLDPRRTVGRLVRDAPCPVLFVRRKSAAPYERILVPVDLSDASERTLRSTVSLGLADRARVTVLHVFRAPGKSRLCASGISRGQIDGYVEGCRSGPARDVERFLAGTGMGDRRWTRQVVEGAPREAIPRIAEDGLADLLVIGARFRTRVGKALLGSVTDDVLSTGGPDVLVVPPLRPRRGRLTWLTSLAGWSAAGRMVTEPTVRRASAAQGPTCAKLPRPRTGSWEPGPVTTLRRVALAGDCGGIAARRSPVPAAGVRGKRGIAFGRATMRGRFDPMGRSWMRIFVARALAVAVMLLVLDTGRRLVQVGTPSLIEGCLVAALSATLVLMLARQ
jgi:nucleotide-binding universal stress UspA family protein